MSYSATHRRIVGVRVLSTVVFLGGAVFGAIPPASGAGTPVPSLGEMTTLCGHFRPILLPGGRALCTHGADPAPDGVDDRTPQPLNAPGRSQGLIFHDPPGDAPSKAAATPGIGCYGDGRDGNRVQAIYAVPSDRTDRYSQVVPSIRQWAAETDAVFQASAAQTGGTRRIRFVTDQNCDLVVTPVVVSPNGDDTFENTIAELQSQGFNRADRKYLVWMDSTVLCGIATYYADSRSTADNFNNGRSGVPGSVSRIDSGCWGLASRGQSVEAHELMHSLGAVLPDAPHSTVNGHCTDDDDRMCYADGSPALQLQEICPSDQEALLDCRHDDYFSTAPPAGSFLANNWNGANSSFLSTTFTSPTLSVADALGTEGDSGTTPLTFTVSLTAPDSRPVTVAFATADGSARAPGDYAATSGSLKFNPGETAKTVTVPIAGDTLNETDETLSLVLSSPSNAVIGRTQAFGTIADNEQAPQGYWFVAADGGIFAFGSAKFYGSTGNLRLQKPIVGMAASPSGNGYWLVASDGGIFAFGDAPFFGSTGNIRLNQPIVGMASTPTGKGYWFVARDGGIFAFGDARFFGAPAGSGQQTIVGMAATPSGNGYWCVARDGTVFPFGDAGNYGAPPKLAQAAGIVPSRSGNGYWIAGSEGTVSAFGDSRSFGGIGNLSQPVVGLATSPKGGGYWLVARDGGIFAFGDARFYGSTGNIRLNQPIVGMTATSTL
jgi:ribosomal protein L24E